MHGGARRFDLPGSAGVGYGLAMSSERKAESSRSLGLQIRPAKATDAVLVADFNARLALETENKRLDPEIALRGARVGLEHPEWCRYFVVECDGRPAGQAMITFEWSDWRCGLFWWFQSVYIHPDYRRRGVFRALFEHISGLARSSPEVCGLRLYVEEHNRSAIETYRRLGLQASGHIVFEQDWSGPDSRSG